MSDVVTKISGDTLESKEARRKKRKAENSKRWRKRNPEKLKAYNEKRRREYQAKQKVSPNNRASVVQMAVDSSNNVYIKAAAASKCSGGDVVKNSPIDNVDTNIDVDEDAG